MSFVRTLLSPRGAVFLLLVLLRLFLLEVGVGQSTADEEHA